MLKIMIITIYLVLKRIINVDILTFMCYISFCIKASAKDEDNLSLKRTRILVKASNDDYFRSLSSVLRG